MMYIYLELFYAKRTLLCELLKECNLELLLKNEMY